MTFYVYNYICRNDEIIWENKNLWWAVFRMANCTNNILKSWELEVHIYVFLDIMINDITDVKSNYFWRKNKIIEIVKR